MRPAEGVGVKIHQQLLGAVGAAHPVNKDCLAVDDCPPDMAGGDGRRAEHENLVVPVGPGAYAGQVNGAGFVLGWTLFVLIHLIKI